MVYLKIIHLKDQLWTVIARLLFVLLLADPFYSPDFNALDVFVAKLSYYNFLQEPVNSELSLAVLNFLRIFSIGEDGGLIFGSYFSWPILI